MHIASGRLQRRINESWEILSGPDGNISERPEMVLLSMKITEAGCHIPE